MKRTLLLLASLACCCASAAEPILNRSSVVAGDPLRDWFLVYKPDGGLTASPASPMALKSTRGGSAAIPLTWLPGGNRADYDDPWWSLWRVPATVPPGSYFLTAGNLTVATVSVAQPGLDRPVVVTTLDALQSACLDVGKKVRAVGTFRLGKTLRLAPYASLDATGATFVCERDNFYSWEGLRAERAAFQPGDYSTVNGGTFLGFDCLCDRQGAKGVVLANLTARDGVWRYGGEYYDIVFDGCRFERFSLNMLGFSTCRNCTWVGCPKDSPATTVWASGAHFIDCRWDDTDRGISWQTVTPITYSLCAGLLFTNVCRTQNGSELLNFEGANRAAGIRVHHVDAHGCVGALVCGWSAGVELQMIDARCGRNPVFLAAGLNDDCRQPQSVGIKWLESEGVVECGNLTDLKLTECAFVSPRVGRHNQRWVDPSWYAPRPALRTRGTGALQRVTVTGLLPDWTEKEGFDK